MRNVIDVLYYFSFFNYSPTFEEIYTFLKKKCSKRHLARILEKMEKKGDNIRRMTNNKLQITNQTQIINDKNKKTVGGLITEARYTLGEYSIKITDQSLKIKNTIQKIKKVKNYIKLLSFFPQIKLVGLSGTVAMMNTEESDDIDLFIISARNRLFTGRFISVMLANLFGIKRKRDEAKTIFSLSRGPAEGEVRLSCDKNCVAESHNNKDKVCLNLFFDEKNMMVPKRKQTEYVAHEVLQMKPLIAKNDIYQRFLAANRWVFRIFPNAQQITNFKFQISNQFSNFKFQISNFVGDRVEQLLKKLQLYFINRHRTTEIITPSQLWFHPEDFGKRLH